MNTAYKQDSLQPIITELFKCPSLTSTAAKGELKIKMTPNQKPLSVAISDSQKIALLMPALIMAQNCLEAAGKGELLCLTADLAVQSINNTLDQISPKR